MTVFFFAYYGLGPQHVWGNVPGCTANVAPLSVLVALVGGLLFLDRTLFVAQHHPRLSLAMRGAALAAGTAAVAFASGLIDYARPSSSAPCSGHRRSCSACLPRWCACVRATAPPCTW